MRKCKVCKQKYTPKKNSLEPCPKQECREILFAKALEKVRKQKDKEEKESIIDYKGKLQSKVQEIARFIDYDHPCLATQRFPKQGHGGHLIARKGNENFAMNLHNIFLQSAQSNYFQNDDGLMRDGVVREFGEDYLEFIRSLKSTPTPKYSQEEYKEIYRNACTISNRLKKNPVKLSNKDRIRYRNEINTELGIYDEKYCVYKIS